MEQPQRLRPDYKVSEDDIRQLMGASTPHFALQIRDRIHRLIAPLPPGDPARVLGEQEIARLSRLAFTGEVRGTGAQEGQRPLASNSGDGPASAVSPVDPTTASRGRPAR